METNGEQLAAIQNTGVNASQVRDVLKDYVIDGMF